jgi:hypothetical protein
MLENGLEKCSCKRKKCERHGNCKECMAQHNSENKKYPLPYCKRVKNESSNKK